MLLGAVEPLREWCVAFYKNFFEKCLRLTLNRKQRGNSDRGEGSEGHMRGDGEPPEERRCYRNRLLCHMVAVARR